MTKYAVSKTVYDMINTALVSPTTVKEVLHRSLCLSSMVSIGLGSLLVFGETLIEVVTVSWLSLYVNALLRLDKQVMKLVKLVVRSGIIP